MSTHENAWEIMSDKVKTPEKKLDSEPIKASDAANAVPENKDGKAPVGVAVGATLPASRITQEDWDKAHKPQAWNETAGGRLAIRTFSRGIMGAMFFTAGGLLAQRMMFGQRNADYT